MKKISSSFFANDAVSVARNMVGKYLVYAYCGKWLAGIIKETEAYTEEDPASHSYLGKKTRRNYPMFDSPGTLYVYMIYGLYYCFNFACERKGVGAAVLIRDVVPTHGIEFMKQNRRSSEKELANGPAKLVQAFGISMDFNALAYHKSPLYLSEDLSCFSFLDVKSYPRIGISKGCDLLWRFRGE